MDAMINIGAGIPGPVEIKNCNLTNWGKWGWIQPILRSALAAGLVGFAARELIRR